MSSPISISDDDESFDVTPSLVEISKISRTIVLSDDEDEEPSQSNVNIRRGIIKNLFPKTSEVKGEFTRNGAHTSENKPQHNITMEGVKVILPVEPYSCQKAVMSKVICALNREENCLVESPTGTGKTLALLCATLAWQKKLQDQISESQAKEIIDKHPEVVGAVDYITSPLKKNVPFPENFFSKKTFGDRSIYDVQTEEPKQYKVEKRGNSSTDEICEDGFVTIHKKVRKNSNDSVKTNSNLEHNPETLTPTKNPIQKDEDTPEKVSLPVIYYGARTHKQLQQVVKEFKRTVYCGEMSMTILSSREKTCLREYDSKQWPSKNDMCTGCTKTFQKDKTSNQGTNCSFYDNRKALNHKTLPPAFDQTDLIEAGERLKACPFYAARDMASGANIVLCPYNYLVDPGIRNSMKINLQDNIVIIDEGHNIEDICRDTASFDFKMEHLRTAIKELTNVASLRYGSQHMMSHNDFLLNVLKKWELWFENQIPLIKSVAINDNEAIKLFEMDAFVNTLNEYSIGMDRYNGFSKNVLVFCKKLREDPRTLVGVTQSTGSLLESLETVLGYLFRDSGKNMKHFTPVFVRKVEFAQENMSWRTSQFEKSVRSEQYILRFICLNPAVIFSGLHSARTVILASGTLTPIDALKAELDTSFPNTISPKHAIYDDRVWVGSLSAGAGGAALRCTRAALRAGAALDALGRAVRAVCAAAPHGVLCFLPSYELMARLRTRWATTGLWQELEELKDVFLESTDARKHEEIMQRYVASVERRGALLLSVFRGKVAEGMDFKDRQARAVITVGIPFSSMTNIAVSEKRKYNDKYSKDKNSLLLEGSEWYRVHAYRALNQALGRCIRHKDDWGALLLIDSRFENPYHREHLSSWVKSLFKTNDHSFNILKDLNAFMIRMNRDDTKT
ncbi:Fanconi anemia group J protein homolog isoform X2 [Nymphalis io]|uniref:Fanconi anemia group J protein homolog isoform X2 n=1 Tax=Inachis io TaxID=171585 RepID=UPI002167C34C|nr:Fanconi anemia group J protein homolog isoform X2 [Nymphalis io]